MQLSVCLPEFFCIHLFHVAIVGQVAIDLDLDIRCLGIDRSRQTLCPSETDGRQDDGYPVC
jgi:hypothetical protein